MSVLFVLVVIGIFVASIFLGAFIWAVKTGQFDDSYTPSVRMLFDDHEEEINNKKENTNGSSIEKTPN